MREVMRMDDTLRKLQLTELEILKVIDKFCLENGIRYSLMCGTLLGAVRHKGFIPWDDDLDICMPREDYDRFVSLWESNPPSGYVLINKENSPEFAESFAKIRKDCSTFLQSGEENAKYHTGIFVDVFPADRRPVGRYKWLILKLRVMVYQLFTREFVPPKGKGSFVERVGSMALLACTPKHWRAGIRRRLLKKITKYNKNTNLDCVFIHTVGWLRLSYPADLFENLIKLEFEGEMFSCFSDWDRILTTYYKDYMTLPPESERVGTHHAVVVDFEHNYDEIKRRVHAE